ncbi:MAG: FliM/FliN family flagellar motor switch protein [Pseudomonadota bacterium]
MFDVPVEVVVSVGRAKPMIGSLLDLKRDSLIPLDSRMEDPVEIFVGDRVIARGELQELPEEGGRLGVRLTEIVEGGVLG